MLSFHNYHHHSVHFANKEIIEMFFFQAIKQLAFGLVSIYVPIYLYTHGVSLFHIMLMYAAHSALHGLFAVLMGKHLLFRVGIKHTFALTTILFTISFVVISQGTTPLFLILWVLFSGLADAFYATAHHSYLALTIDERSAGKEVATLSILTIATGIVTPFVGAVFILIFGFSNMFIVGSILLIISVVPLFYSPEIDISKQIRTRGFSFIRDFWKTKKHVALSSVGNGFDAATLPFWQPLYLFKLLGGIKLLGALTSIVALVQIFSNYIGGKRTDEHKNSFKTGIKGSIFARLFTLVSFHPYVAIFSEIVNSVVSPLFITAFHVFFYKEIKGDNTINNVISHEFFWHSTNTLVLLAVSASVYFVGWYAFIFVGLCMIIGRVILYSQNVGSRV